jgi:hypothetical protein
MIERIQHGRKEEEREMDTNDNDRTRSVRQEEGKVADHFKAERLWVDSEDDASKEAGHLRGKQ